MNLPTDIGQQALDAAAVDYQMGEIEDGTRPAAVLLRAYTQCLMQLLRGANWDFARKTAPLLLLADVTGQTEGVGTLVPVPWVYEYAYPQDCMKARLIPWNQAWPTSTPPGNITNGFTVQGLPPSPPGTPLVTGLGNPQLAGDRIVPARFVIATDANYPPPAGSQDALGVSAQGRTVILTNVKFATLIYTALISVPVLWDSLFRAAFVSYLASEISLPLAQDKKFGLTMRAENIKLTKLKVEEARIRDGNEGWYSSDLRVDWMAARISGRGGYGGYGALGEGGPVVPWGGGFGWGWDAIGFADGTAY